MSVLAVSRSVPVWVRVVSSLGRDLVKQSEDGAPEVAYNLSGQLYLAADGWLLLSVPNALVYGIFGAMKEPGIELPPGRNGGRMNAHIVVMSPDEIERIGGPDRITERGKQFHYTLGRLYSMVPADCPGIARVWYCRVHAPELQALRRSYGLSGHPGGDRHDFYIVCALRRRGVLGRNDISKTDGPVRAGR